MFCSWDEGVIETLKHSAEAAGLARKAVGYYDVQLLLEKNSSGDIGVADAIASVNVARNENADHVNDVIFRTVLNAPKVSRRDLLRSIPKILRVESDIPVVLKDVCGPRFRSCHYCRDACAYDAIRQDGDGIVIDNRQCVECGACARDCPVGAIQCPSLSDAQISAMLNEFSNVRWNHTERLLVLTCEIGMRRLSAEIRNGASLRLPIVPVVVPCIGSIASHHFLEGVLQGVRLVTVCPDPSCVNFKALAPMHKHILSYGSVLGEPKATAENTAIQHLVIETDDSITKRLSLFAEPEIHPDKLTEFAVGGRRNTTLSAIRLFHKDRGTDHVAPETSFLPLFDLTIKKDNCTFCELCQGECPDHAIKFVKDGESSTLMFNASLCGGCLICRDKCPEKAIVISRVTQFSNIVRTNVLEKARDEVAKCAVCGTPLGWKRAMEGLERKFSQAGYSEQMLKMLRLCHQCKQKALIGVNT